MNIKSQLIEHRKWADENHPNWWRLEIGIYYDGKEWFSFIKNVKFEGKYEKMMKLYEMKVRIV